VIRLLLGHRSALFVIAEVTRYLYVYNSYKKCFLNHSIKTEARCMADSISHRKLESFRRGPKEDT